jgi:hypothetical protein
VLGVVAGRAVVTGAAVAEAPGGVAVAAFTVADGAGLEEMAGGADCEGVAADWLGAHAARMQMAQAARALMVTSFQ